MKGRERQERERVRERERRKNSNIMDETMVIFSPATKKMRWNGGVRVAGRGYYDHFRSDEEEEEEG